MSQAIVIVGMACQYPDAKSPGELWENALAGRQAFRRLPPERLRLEDYFSSELDAADSTYSSEAAVIEGYDFDRVRFSVAGSSFRSADMAHWLALDVAAQALSDAGFNQSDLLPRDTTGVFVGNTLTGEFSRANLLRLRWPYVCRVLESALAEESWPVKQRRDFLERVEASYKSPFPPLSEESLAGGLSNTIAGRICNHFDLKGGGYTVDGACASSLLAIATACSALACQDIDVAIAGGVDLSLDPFELVGFARAGALAQEKMRVFDARSSGFWPGEGCGFVVLMRYEDALALHCRTHAIIRGWGVSSDGSGGITRPEVEGQLLALRRAYRRAGYSISSVTYFEGHGTGTSVGDATELKSLSRARREAAPGAPPAVIGSIKANIGHTKAAAGVAGLIKATMALNAQILPPTTGCDEPHSELAGDQAALAALKQGELWPHDRPLRASVSAMGFGGINAHLTIESSSADRRSALTAREKALLASAQDCELFLFIARDREEMCRSIERISKFAARLSRSELTDLAALLERTLRDSKEQARYAVRAALVASTPSQLAERIESLLSWLQGEAESKIDAEAGLFLGTGAASPRLGFLFPGQGSPVYTDGGYLARRFDSVNALYRDAGLRSNGGKVKTGLAQPAIVTASIAGLKALEMVGVTAQVAVGHSLGEITAMYWGGAFDQQALIRIAHIRGAAMENLKSPDGAMASLSTSKQQVEALINGDPVVIAALNSPGQTIISGEATAIAALVKRARSKGFSATAIPVSHAFHSPLVAAAVPALAGHLSSEPFQPLQRKVVSTITGAPLAATADLKNLLCRQVTSPVQFIDAIQNAVQGLDLLIEVGPGQTLNGIVSEFIKVPSVALDSGGPSSKGLMKAIGAAFSLGAAVDCEALFAGRFARPFNLDWNPKFFSNPCEMAPLPADEAIPTGAKASTEKNRVAAETEDVPASAAESPLEVLRYLVAKRAELPLSAVKDESRLLGDLHLNSIKVSQIVAEAARQIGLPPPIAPTDYSNVTLAIAAQALEELMLAGASVSGAQQQPQGVDSWIRPFIVEMVARALPRHTSPARPGQCQVIAPADYPLSGALEEAFANWGAEAVVLCVPPAPGERHIRFILEAARCALARRASRFVIVQHGGGASAFARTFHLEASQAITCVVDVPIDHPEASSWVLQEAKAASSFSEAHYDMAGQRSEPVTRLITEIEPGTVPLPGPDDVLLVTGGGKGIGAECATWLARQTGVALALIGRASPDKGGELAANLARMEKSGIRFRYYVADVTNAESLKAAAGRARRELGEITAVLHAAGVNTPQSLNSLNEEAFLALLAPKLQGLRNVLAAIDPDRLKHLVTFGSLIARAGMHGEAHYAVANEWMARLVEQWQAEHPSCRSVNIDWSVWSGIGMGERLGAVETLMQQGVTPIPIDEGVRMFGRLLESRLPAVSVIVSGRFGETPTVNFGRSDLPFMRFLEQPRLHYPGVELVVDAELSEDADPYLNDHVFQGERLLPAVMGLEAMAEVAKAVAAMDETPVFEDVTFDRPVVVPGGEHLKIRLAALVREPGIVEVALRSEETAFQVNHFRAICRFGCDRLIAPPSQASHR
ncbi:MAG TPA: type I polyketide synthase, partial [Blastocatellia bacterium]